MGFGEFLRKAFAFLTKIKHFPQGFGLAYFTCFSDENQAKSASESFIIFILGVLKMEITKDKYVSFINHITLSEFNNLIKNINLVGLLKWLSSQTEDVIKTTLKLEPYTNKLIDKYSSVSDNKNINTDRKYYAVGLSIKIMKSMYSRTVTIKYVEDVPYKEGLVKNNIDIIEQIIFEILNAGYKKFKWSQVFKEFFKRIDKTQLKGNDKLKKDCSKIMSLNYFRETAKKYIFEKSKVFDDRIKKKDIISLIENDLQKAKQAEFAIHSDVFSSDRR